MNRSRKFLWLGLFACALALGPGPAIAQESTDAGTAAAPAGDAGAGATGAAGAAAKPAKAKRVRGKAGALPAAGAGAAAAAAQGTRAVEPAPGAAPTGRPAATAPNTDSPTGVSGAQGAGPGAAPGMTPSAPAGGLGGEYPNPDEGELYRCKNLPKNAKFKVTLKPETDLKDLVNWAMSFTCRNFIFGQGIMGRASKVTIIAPAEMTPGEAWNLFLVSLQTMNLNVVPKGRTLEIVESQSTREKPLPVYKGGAAPNSDQIVRAVFRPEGVSVDDATQVLNSLKSKDGTVTPLPNMGVIIVTDYGSSIVKMGELMRQLDAPGEGEKIYIIHVRNADAAEIGNKLNEIFGTKAGGAPGAAPPQVPQNQGRNPRAVPRAGTPGMVDATANVTPSKIITDERTNSLIVIASEPAYQRILALVKRLDEPMEGGEGGIHVYYLNNADAEEMSTTLSSVISGSQQAPRGGPQARAGQGGAAPGAAGGGGGAFEGSVRVTFDKPTNSLVIVSSVKDFLALREVVRLLDVPRRQVFVEATIMEVSLAKTRRMGISFHGGIPYEVDGKQSILVGGVQHSDLGTLSLNPSSLLGGIAGGFGPTIPESTQILGLAIPSFGVLFQLLQNNNDVNVLSSPHILTTDNVPAEISIGQNIPVASGTGIPNLGGAAGAAAGLGLGLGTQVQRQDVGLKLKITPHVNESDMVRLEIEQEINAIASENFGGLGASWTKRSVKTTIVVKDQEPVVIGGLMNDEMRINESKVPLLGDIPILGYLFKFKRTTKQKTNLLIFLTPYVIKDQADIRRIFDRKMQERREFMRSYTMFQDAEFEPDIDYGRKRGLIEEINHVVRAADEDEQMLREAEARKQQRDDQGPVEMPSGMGPDEPAAPGDGSVPPPPSEQPAQPNPNNPPNTGKFK